MSDAVMERHIAAHFGGLADDDTGAVVDEDAAAVDRAGIDIHGQEASDQDKGRAEDRRPATRNRFAMRYQIAPCRLA
ncbi:hypothetical protein ACFFWD_31265 [Bradyrhizobium erythrophlei]|uniref:hypothetical protein n=1 Tax=Bradyrhizobium erythrophlei TaxID=1437360 RepID=UPI0035EE4B59